MKLARACAGVGACAVSIAIYAVLPAQRPRGDAKPIELAPGAAVTGLVGSRDVARIDYVLDVPADAVTARFDVVARGQGLVLRARAGRRVGEAGVEGQDDAAETVVDGRASLHLDRTSDPEIRAGRWYLCVETWDGRAGADTSEAVPFTLVPRTWRAEVHATLEIGRRTSGEIPARDIGHRTLRVDVPDGARALRIDVVDTDADVDLYAAHGAPALHYDDATPAATHGYGRETLVIPEPGGAAIRPGPWFVDVVAPWDDDRSVRFEVLATLAPEPPAELLALPRLPERSARAAPELARALCAVVELTSEDGSGSGVLVGDRGWILTNAHVVEGAPGTPLDEVVVGCTLVPERPAVELFRGRVERYDADRDLALVRVASGFYGQPVPADYRFPTLELGDGGALLLGSPLWLVGYPATGGEGSRVTIHATRGIVSGFEHGALADLIKTDAEITQGNSGGAALDGAGKLVGVPSSTVENGSGQSGFVRPLGLVPASWLELVRAR